jgi:hypothetical protein
MHPRHRSLLAILLVTLCFGTGTAAAQEEGQTGWVANPELVATRQAAERKRNRNINYLEEQVPELNLPDPLVMKDGSRVATPQQWVEQRRPEILEMFSKLVYGRAPIQRPDNMSFEIIDEDRQAIGGAAVRKQVKIGFRTDRGELSMHVGILLPNQADRPVPIFLLICNRSPDNIDPLRETKSEFWPVEEMIARGYGAAAFHNAEIDPDNFDDFKNGIHRLYDNPEGRPKDAWATLCAWAWGASRVMDYFETDEEIDHRRIAVVGHSRGGKTSLWAGARDPRFAMVISNESGCGGAALSKRKYGETVAQINKTFPHWFCENFKKFNDREEDLPVDQHMLMALIAPRPLYVASADEDLWADPRGEFLAALHASPVYELLGQTGLAQSRMPPLDTPVHEGRIGYHVRSGSHNLTLYDWNRYMDFADKHLRKH